MASGSVERGAEVLAQVEVGRLFSRKKSCGKLPKVPPKSPKNDSDCQISFEEVQSRPKTTKVAISPKLPKEQSKVAQIKPKPAEVDQICLKLPIIE